LKSFAEIENMSGANSFNAMYAPPQALLADRSGIATPGSVRIEYELTTRDLMRFRLMHMFAAKGTYIWGTGVAMLLALTVGQAHGVESFLRGFALYFAIFVAFGLVMQVIGTLAMRKSTYLTRHAVELREDGFYDESVYMRQLIYWNGVLSVADKPGYVAVYIEAHNAYLIPDRAFRGEVSREAFAALARQRVAAAIEGQRGEHSGTDHIS
jgi:hypothetical protein